jgi:RimJ/RimL family protein N-acetyltransferase
METRHVIGIVAGCMVFAVTIATVIYLLYRSGTFSRLVEEMSSQEIGKKSGKKIRPFANMILNDVPALYTELLEAILSLSDTVVADLPEIRSERVTLRPLCIEDEQDLKDAGNGSARFGASAYDPLSVFGWLDWQAAGATPTQCGDPLSCVESLPDVPLSAIISSSSGPPGTKVVLIDPKIRKAIGMLQFLDSTPRDLSARIENLWLSPAYHGRKVAAEAIYQALTFLFEHKYRRVTAETSTRNVAARRLLERSGFTLEATLRKHRVRFGRNQDTALYTMLNSEWQECAARLRKNLGYKPVSAGVRLFEIQSAEDAIQPQSIEGSCTVLPNKKKA